MSPLVLAESVSVHLLQVAFELLLQWVDQQDLTGLFIQQLGGARDWRQEWHQAGQTTVLEVLNWRHRRGLSEGVKYPPDHHKNRKVTACQGVCLELVLCFRKWYQGAFFLWYFISNALKFNRGCFQLEYYVMWLTYHKRAAHWPKSSGTYQLALKDLYILWWALKTKWSHVIDML